MENENNLPNPESLDLVYSASKDAYAQLMNEVDINHGKADQQIQTGLVLIGILFAAIGTLYTTDIGLNLVTSLPNSVGFLILISALLLSISSIISASAKLWGKFSAGTIYPHVLASRLTEESNTIKTEIIDSISRSYYHNLQTLATKARFIGIAGVIQLFAIILLFIDMAIVVIHLSSV